MTEPTTPRRTWPTRRLPAREFVALAGILLGGLLLRVLYLRENMTKPEFSVPAIDAGFHDYWARGLAFGRWTPPHDYPDPNLRQRPYLRPPGYPYFLSIVYRLAGPGYLAPRLVQIGLGLVGCLLAFAFARRWYGPTVAFIVAACTGVYWIFIYFEGEFHAPALLICLLWPALGALGLWRERPSLLRAMTAGLFLGAGALVRPNVLLFAPVFVGWAYWAMRPSGGRRSLLVGLSGFLVGLALAIAPAAIRNYLVAGDFVLISSNAGINLYMGNNEQTDGRVSQAIPGLGRFHTCYDYPALVANVQRRLGRKLKDSEVSAYFTDQALGFIRRHPDRFLGLTLHKAVLFWSPREIPHNKMINCERADSAVLRRIPGNFALVLGLFVLGLVRLAGRRDAARPACHRAAPFDCDRRKWETSLLILLVVAAYFFSLVPFFMAARYRVPITPFLLLLGAYGLEGMIHRAGSAASWRRSLLGFAWLILCVTWGRPAEPHPFDQAKWHADRGAAYLLAGNMEPALAEYNEALVHNPRFAEAHYSLGLAWARLGHQDRAIAQARLCIDADPDNTFGYTFLGDLLLKSERYEEARTAYRRGLAAPQLDPLLMARAASFLATCPRRDLRDVGEALRLAQEACRLTENRWPETLAALADAYAADGQIEPAAEAARGALQLAATQHKTELIAELESKLRTYRPATPDP